MVRTALTRAALPGPVMLDLVGEELTAEESEILLHPAVGGVIFFARNYHSLPQIRALIAAIHARCPELLLAVDQEGGRVQRFQEHFTRLPALAEIGAEYKDNPDAARAWAHKAATTMASELLAVGIDFSFAPVLDVSTPQSSVIGDRAFHKDPEVVSDLVGHYLAGLQEAGMPAVGKHFPGHGSVEGDSHYQHPVDKRSYAAISAVDMQPFQRHAAALDGMMTAHVTYPNLDAQIATFSHHWLTEILRNQLGFRGVIFSDCLSMKGATGLGDIEARTQAALEAGCDMVLVCNDRPSAVRALEVCL